MKLNEEGEKWKERRRGVKEESGGWSGEMKVRRKGSSSDWRGERGEEGGRKGWRGGKKRRGEEREERRGEREEGREEEEVERMEEVTEISMTQLNLDSTYMQ